MLVGILLVPPLSLSFTVTQSTMSLGLVLAAAYLPWRLVKLRGRFVAAGTLYGAVTTLLVAYVSLHALYYLVGERHFLVFLMEAQWAVYFAAFTCLLFDVKPLHGAREKVVRALLLVVLCQAILGIVSSYVGPLLDVGAWTEGRFGLSQYRATGTLGSPNGFAGVIAFGAVVALFHDRAGLPLPRAVLVPPILVALFLSQSKSGWVAFLLSGLVVLLARFLLTTSARDFALAVGLGALLVAAARTPEVVNELSSDYAGRVTFGERTLERYERSEPGYQVFGLGFRQTAEVDPETRGWLTAHNSYLSFLAETGLVGILLLCAVWTLTLWWILRTWDWAMLAALTCMLLHLYTEAFLYGNVYVLLMALVLGLSHMRHRQPEAPGAFILEHA
jgi:O-antigen ligase